MNSVTLSAGTRLGPYEILSPLGAGGMGEVYKARDIRLDRFVAIKVLPPDVAADPGRIRRFEQEARAASALNHPNILTVYDIGSADAISFIATELIEGKTLRDLLLHGPLPVKRLLDIAVQIADGLACAHEAGIVHRDLKPANLMISKDGFVKILDFGLAKLPFPAPKLTGGGSTSTTESILDTEPGAIVGTVDYMSPEQASGNEIDSRSDQFSFGSILHEMATGRRAFRRKTNIETLAAILHEEPQSISRDPKLPAPLKWIIERCLAKSANERFIATRDLARDLTALRDRLPELNASTDSGAVGLTRFFRNSWTLASAWVALAVGLGLLIALHHQSSPTGTRSMCFSVIPPEKTSFNSYSSAPAPAVLSPDGRLLAFGARDLTGRSLLFVRSLNHLVARPLEGTDGATYPFWSPDSRSLGFFASGKLKRIDAENGVMQTLCDAPDGRGGSWGPKGIILFSPSGLGPIHRVSEEGGDVRPVTKLPTKGKNVTHRWPAFLPDGRHFLYLSRDTALHRGDGIWVASLDDSVARLLLTDVSNAIYAATGHLLFVRDGSLVALRFDTKQLRVIGSAVPVAAEIQYHPYRWNGVFSVSDTGALLFQSGQVLETSELIWFDRSGKELATVGGPGLFAGLRLSPDGRFCAVEVRDGRTEGIDIWVADLSRNIVARVTQGVAIHDSPIWTPDGRRLVYASNRKGGWKLYQAERTGDHEEVLLEDADGIAPSDWSPDERTVLLNARRAETEYRSEIWSFSVARGRAVPLMRNVANQLGGRFSPNGEWLAYCSDESGRAEVYVVRVKDLGGKTRVSGNGGGQPVWRRDGREIFYLGSDNRIMSAEVKIGSSAEVRSAVPLFTVRPKTSASDISLFDVAADGQRFLVNTTLERGEESPLTIVLNWIVDLKP